MSERDLRNPISIDIPSRTIDRARDVANQNVPLPSGIFKPRQLAQPACQRDDIRLAVVIDVPNDYLVTANQTSSDCMLRKIGARNTLLRAVRQDELTDDECRKNQADRNHSFQQSHNVGSLRS